MKKNRETGNVKNAANFEDLISFCEGYKTAYQPSNAQFELTALQTLLLEARTKMDELNTAITDFNNATNERAILFQPLRKLSTRIVNALEVSGATALTVANAKAILRKIQGRRAPTHIHLLVQEPVAEGTPQPVPTSKEISAAQTGYDNQTEHLARLISTLHAEPLYTPNETELTPTKLSAMLTAIKAANTAVIAKATALSNARIARNKIMYDSDTGIHHIALEIKKYIKSVFGTNSPEYRQVSRIKFTRARF
ncbi:MAG: hypothetical protein ABI199_02825 [Bacteroidia bacterium]